MTNKIITAAICFAIITFTSCKKEDAAVSTSLSASSVDGLYTETSLTVQKPITHQIDANIGGYMEALPAHYSDHPTLNYPLIIYLHGQGSLGNGSQSSFIFSSARWYR